MQCCCVQLVSWYDNEWGYSNRVRSKLLYSSFQTNLFCLLYPFVKSRWFAMLLVPHKAPKQLYFLPGTDLLLCCRLWT